MSIKILDGRNTLLQNLYWNKVALDVVVMADKTKFGQYVLAIMGLAHVTNIAYKKDFFVRVTFDNWKTYTDYRGAYMESSRDKKSDIFSFGFTWRKKDEVTIEFALCCTQKGISYWDNNNGKNYSVYIPSNPFRRN